MTTPTLTDRYVAAVIRRLPEKSRTDVATELRASIDDDIEARVAAGAGAESAERDALSALGDPDRLAAGYAGTPLHLIGPAVYLDWRRLLTLLLSIVLPIVAGALVLAQALSGAGPLDIVASVVGTTISVGIAMAFWVTVVFAIIERTGAAETTVTSWSLDRLPAADAKPQVGIDVLIGGVLGLLFLVAGLVAQSAFPAFRDTDGEAIPFLEPALWSWWIPYFVVVLIAELIFAIVLYRRRAWNFGLAVGNIVITLAFAVPLIVLLLSDSVVNPAFSAQLARVPEIAQLSDVPVLAQFGGQATVITAIVVGVIALWECIDGVLKAGRAMRPALVAR